MVQHTHFFPFVELFILLPQTLINDSEIGGAHASRCQMPDPSTEAASAPPSCHPALFLSPVPSLHVPSPQTLVEQGRCRCREIAVFGPHRFPAGLP